MKVLLLTPDITGRYGKPSCPPVGMAYLMSYLKSRGHLVDVLDLRLENHDFDYISKIKEFNPDLVGIGFTSYNYKKSYSLISDIKQKTGVKIVIGGPHISVTRDEILKEVDADYAIYGEGEIPLANLADNKDPVAIKSLVWRNKGRIVVNEKEDFIFDLDSLPFPEYELFKQDRYASRRIPITTARGCPHMCVYCAVDRVIGRRFRARSPENVIDEIESWYKKGYRDFGFNDSTFTENMKRAERICDLLIERKIKIKWDLRTGIRVDRINAGLLRKLKTAGCDFIAFGIESFDKDVLKAMRKGTTPQQAEEAIRMAKDAGLGVGGFFMIGNPEDSYDAFKRSYSFAKNPIFDEIRFYNAEPYPGTEFYEWIQNRARFLVSIEESLNSCSRWSEQPIFESDIFPKKERIKAFNEGEVLVVAKLINKVLGPRLSLLPIWFCRFKPIRRFILNTGFKLSAVIFKVLKKDRNG
ncbi:MAG: radical SAM protein [Candidatus Orphnella occulta]|nr:radical SAM protein [Candidatus Orphnella occulta]